jgi:O-antigen/teichoic acid export membrane protein
MFNIKLSSFFKDIVVTTVTSIAGTISMIFVIKFLANGMGPEEFGAYSLARRVISNLAPLVILSMDVALTRYIAMTQDKRMQSSYIVASLIFSGMAILFLLIISIFFGRQLSTWIFQSHEYLNLYHASLFLLGGYTISVLTSAALFGMQKINEANGLHLIVLAILPFFVSIALASRKNSALIVFLMGLALYLSLLPLLAILWNRGRPRSNDIKMTMSVLFKYSFPRFPAGFLLAGLLTLGPFLASRFLGLKEAGYFVIGQSVFRVMEAGIVAFGLVALPKVSRLLAEEKKDFVKNKIEDILVMVFQLGLFLTIHTYIWSKEIILIWLGREYSLVIPIMKILILALCPYLVYVLLRSIVDAVEVRAINTLNLFVSLIVSGIISIILIFVGFGTSGISVGTTIGLASLGILTGNYLRRRYEISLRNFMLKRIFFWNAIFVAFIILLKYVLISYLSMAGLFLLGVAAEVSLYIFYLYLLNKNNAHWVLEIKKRILHQAA